MTLNPDAEDLDEEMRRFEWKVDAGAEYAITRPVFDVSAFERVHRRLEASTLPVVLSLRPFEDLARRGVPRERSARHRTCRRGARSHATRVNA